MRWKLLLPLLSVGMLVFAIYHVVRAQHSPPQLPPVNEPARNTFSRTIAGAGVVESATENISLGSHLPGVVAEVYVKAGSTVDGPRDGQPGTALFRLDDRQLQAELRVRKANLDAAEAGVRKLKSLPRPEELPALEARVKEAKALLEDARDQHMRARELAKTRGAIGEEELQRKRQAVIVAEAQRDRAEAELKLMQKGAWEFDIAVSEAAVQQAKSLLHQTETELKRLTVHAPIMGTVLQCNVRPGEFVGSPPGQVLMMLGDLKKLHVRMDVDESDIPRFSHGLPGKASPRGAAVNEVTLKFLRVEPMVIPKRALTGAGSERVDTRVLQVIYEMEANRYPWYVGQQLDIFLDATSTSKE